MVVAGKGWWYCIEVAEARDAADHLTGHSAAPATGRAGGTQGRRPAFPWAAMGCKGLCRFVCK